MVHEAGYTLGLSEFSLIDVLHADLTDINAHHAIYDSVMSYHGRFELSRGLEAGGEVAFPVRNLPDAG